MPVLAPGTRVLVPGAAGSVHAPVLGTEGEEPPLAPGLGRPTPGETGLLGLCTVELGRVASAPPELPGRYAPPEVPALGLLVRGTGPDEGLGRVTVDVVGATGATGTGSAVGCWGAVVVRLELPEDEELLEELLEEELGRLELELPREGLEPLEGLLLEPELRELLEPELLEPELLEPELREPELLEPELREPPLERLGAACSVCTGGAAAPESTGNSAGARASKMLGNKGLMGVSVANSYQAERIPLGCHSKEDRGDRRKLP